MFSISNYRVAYGQSEIIPGMDFQVQENEIVTILGRNGMGKTTLMKSIMGMSGEETGSITLKRQEIVGLKSYDRVRSGLAFVPQGRMIFSTMTVQENIETGLTSTRRKRVSADIYELFPVLKEMKSRRGGNLSGGQQQQLAIARALASDPKVLLLDEPTEGIQPSIIKEIARTLKRIRDQRGLSIIASEQVLSFALDIADRIMVIEKGVIVQNESAAEVNPDKVAAYLSV